MRDAVAIVVDYPPTVSPQQMGIITGYDVSCFINIAPFSELVIVFVVVCKVFHFFHIKA